MKYFYLLCISTLLFASACKPKKGDNNIVTPEPEPIANFMPTAAGSYWLYKSTENGPFKREATGIDSLKVGYVFKYFTYEDINTGDKNPEYFGKFDGKYYTLFTFDVGTSDNYLKAILMPDSAKVGDTWTNTGQTSYGIIDINMEISGKVTSTTESYFSDTINSANVIKVENTLRFKVAGSPAWTNGGTITMWFAKGIGVVKQKNDISILSFYTKNNTDSLYQYHIAP